MCNHFVWYLTHVNSPLFFYWHPPGTEALSHGPPLGVCEPVSLGVIAPLTTDDYVTGNVSLTVIHAVQLIGLPVFHHAVHGERNGRLAIVARVGTCQLCELLISYGEFVIVTLCRSPRLTVQRFVWAKPNLWVLGTGALLTSSAPAAP